jgi:hypothetical protein
MAKGNKFWLKIGTIRYRTTWYIHGDPPIGLKTGDDADPIDLDVSLEQFALARDFLSKVLQSFASESDLNTSDFLTSDALDRLVLASGGVARDFLGIFRRSVNVAKLRIAERGLGPRGPRIGAEDVNRAAGDYHSTKQEELQLDTGSEERRELVDQYKNIVAFCTRVTRANILLIDYQSAESERDLVEELADLRLLHRVKASVSISKRPGKKYSAYMLDLSQYAGARKIRYFDIVPFWTDDVNLRQLRYIYDFHTDYSTYELGKDEEVMPAEQKDIEQGRLFGDDD